jgi:hypothetical protein
MDHSNRSGLRPVAGSTMPSADFCPAVRSPLDSLSHVPATTEQISWGNSSRLPRAIAGSTLSVLDEYGLRNARPARPTLVPHIRFLFIDSRFCSTLLSDAPSWSRPCASLTLHPIRLGRRLSLPSCWTCPAHRAVFALLPTRSWPVAKTRSHDCERCTHECARHNASSLQTDYGW